jgi:transcription antitermination factor NusA-like protein
MRNIGIKMVDTGQIDAGIAEGSALTAKEQKEAEKPKDTSDFQEFLSKEQFKNMNELMNDVDYANALSEEVLKTETADVMVYYLKQAKSLVEKGDVAGVIPVINESINKAVRFFGVPRPQSDREKAKALLSFVSKADVKELLGESGRTISNIDRSIAEELVGKIDVATGKEDLIAQLEKSIAKYESSYTKNLRNYNSRIKQYQKYNITPPFQLGKSIEKPQEVERVRLRLN